MGKGDQRSRRGKIWRGTFGKRRPKTSNKVPVKVVAAPVAPVAKPVRKKAAAVPKAEPVVSAAEDTPPAPPQE